MSEATRLVVPGTCRVCGCTSERACDEGCAWIDAERTLCSACAEGGMALDFERIRQQARAQADARGAVEVSVAFLEGLLDLADPAAAGRAEYVALRTPDDLELVVARGAVGGLRALPGRDAVQLYLAGGGCPEVKGTVAEVLVAIRGALPTSAIAAHAGDASDR